ncbi:MAG: EF-hand domain-containing protein [Isosphaeraceae bacterium]
MKRKGLVLAGVLGMALPIASSFAAADDPQKSADEATKSAQKPAGKRLAKGKAGPLGDRLFDGKDSVTREQFEAYLKEHGAGAERREKAAGKLFERLDRDNDGKLTKDEARELPAMLRGRLAESAKGGGDRLFEAMADGKDLVSKDQFESYLKKHATRVEQRPKAAEKLFDRLDDNNDGKLSRDELKKMPQMLERLREAVGKKGK